MPRLAYFGLPLGALLLATDGHRPDLVVLSPIEAPGRRRLARILGAGGPADGGLARPARLLDARALGPDLDAAVDQALAAAPPDLLVSWFWTRRLPARWLELPRLGALGVHPSLLPRHRGPNPFFAAIDQGDAETGITVHRLEPEYDTGAILLQERLATGERDAWQLARALDRPSLRGLRGAVSALMAGRTLPETPQDPALATWAPDPEESGETTVDWRWPVERVVRRVRALSPVPGLAIELAGTPLFVTRVTAAAGVDPGWLRALHPGEAFRHQGAAAVRAGAGAVLLERALDGEGAVLDRAALGALVVLNPAGPLAAAVEPGGPVVESEA